MKNEIDQAVVFVSNLLPGAFLPVEEQIFRHCWEGKSYQEIGRKHNCKVDFVQKLAECFWGKLSHNLGEPITKTNCRRVIKRHLIKPKPGGLEPVAEFWINERGMGKARPRKTSRSRKMHMPPKYAAWMKRAVLALEIQMADKEPAPLPAYVECYFVNFLSSDSDNLTGAVEDAMVKAGYLGNDSSSYVVDSRGRFAKTPRRRGIPLDVGILVKVYEGEIVVLEPDVVDSFRLKYPKIFASTPKRVRLKK